MVDIIEMSYSPGRVGPVVHLYSTVVDETWTTYYIMSCLIILLCNQYNCSACAYLSSYILECGH